MTSRVLDCDHVFDVLTRGPFRGEGKDDALVESHLKSCAGCRQLAEALRPAVDLFHESLDDEQLPSYEGALPPADDNVVTAVMTKVRQAAPPIVHHLQRPERKRRIDPLSIIAAGVIGLILGVLIASPGERFEKPRFSLNNAVDPDSHGLATLDELQLMTACRVPDAVAHVADPPSPEPHAVASYACCTQCHNVDQTHGVYFKTRRSMSKLLQGCQACHKAA